MPLVDRTRLCAAENTAHWDVFMLALCDALGAKTGGVLWHDLVGAGGVLASARNDPEAARLYATQYAALDPRALSPVTTAIRACHARHHRRP